MYQGQPKSHTISMDTQVSGQVPLRSAPASACLRVATKLIVSLIALAILALPDQGCSGRSRASGDEKNLDPSNLGPKAVGLDSLFDTSALDLAGKNGGLRFTAMVHMARRQGDSRKPAPDPSRKTDDTQTLGPVDPGSPVELTQSLELEVDSKGRVHGKSRNDREYGYEFVWMKPRLFFRLRYRPFMYWKGERREALSHVRRIWQAPKRVWHLLAPCMKLQRETAAKSSEGAKGATYRLVLSSGRPAGPKDGWQSRARCRSLVGRMTVAKGPVVTKLSLSAVIDLEPADGKSSPPQTLELVYHHEVQLAPKDLGIEAPKAEPAPVRMRPELDRLELLGRRPKPGWYRGGGPVRWWRRHRNRRSVVTRPGATNVTRSRRVRPGPGQRRAGHPRKGARGAPRATH